MSTTPQGPEDPRADAASGADAASALNTPPPADSQESVLGESSLQRFMDESEFPPDFVAEQRSVLLQPGHVLANRFEVREMLGFGGMGTVYRVTDWRLQEDKALKIMLPSLVSSEAARQRFLAEIKISQRLSHQRIVRVHDFGEDPQNSVQFFTMELVQGKTLHKHLMEKGGRLELDEAMGIMRQLLEALDYAHAQTIHRDLKPQNVMIQPDGIIKVLDFGLAKLMSPGRMAKSSMALGTAYYQAPEQSVRKGDVDQRADIYSLGVILYEMLVGELPVGRFAPPSEAVKGLPKKLDHVIMKCLSPQPENRYGSVAELQSALEVAVAPSGLMGNLRGLGVAGAIAAGLLAVLLIAWGMRPDGAALPEAPPKQSIAQPTAEEEAAEALASAERAALAAQAAAEDAWVNVPAGANEYAAEMIGEASAARENGNALIAQGQSDKDPDAYHRAVEAYTEAREKFAAATAAVEQALAEGPPIGAEDVGEMRSAAMDARAQAQQAGVAEEELAAADAFFDQAEQLKTSDDFETAAAKYQDAQGLYVQATKALLQALSTAAQAAQEAAVTARASALANQATPAELEAGDAALARGTAAVDAGDYAAADTEFAAAAQAFADAAVAAEARMTAAELRNQLEQVRPEAEMARTRAVNAQANDDELKAGTEAFAAAETAEQQGDLSGAIRGFGSARDEFNKAMSTATTRVQDMEKDLKAQVASAKSSAETARKALTEAERNLVAKDVQAADNTWANALKAEAANDVTKAIADYKASEGLYADARRSAQKTMKASQDRMAEAKRGAEASRGKINDAARSAAPDSVTQGDASWAEAIKAEEAGAVDTARQQYESARASYDRAVQAAAQKAQEMAAKEKQPETDAAAAKAREEAEAKARQAMVTAKTKAEGARSSADSATVKEFADAEVTAAGASFRNAQAAEDKKDYPRAASLYGNAETQYKGAVTAAAERQSARERELEQARIEQEAAMAAAEARGAMDAARTNAINAQRAAATDQTREYAADALRQADAQWASAERAAASGDVAGATRLYDAARSAYGSAQTTAATVQAEQEKSGGTERLPIHLRKRGTGR